MNLYEILGYLFLGSAIAHMGLALLKSKTDNEERNFLLWAIVTAILASLFYGAK